MAKAVINLQKESGGIVKISPVDGTGVTEVTVPESGNLVSVNTAVTDNAIARYDSTTGKLQNSGVVIDDEGNVGIGTNNPDFPLEVVGNDTTVKISNNNTGLTTTALQIGGYSGSPLGIYGSTLRSIHNFGVSSASSLAFELAGTERMRIDANGNVGIGVTPSAWTNSRVLQLGSYSSIHESTANGAAYIGSNIYRSGPNINNYIVSGWGSTLYEQNNGTNKWSTAPSGTAGSPITWNTAMTLGANGNLLVGTTTDNGIDKLQVNGSISAPFLSGFRVLGRGDNTAYAGGYRTVKTVTTNGDGGANSADVYVNIKFGPKAKCIAAFDENGNSVSPSTIIQNSNLCTFVAIVCE